MIKSKKQGVVFGLIMSYAMAIGMEVYNVAIKQGGLDSMTNSVFPAALKEAAYMGLIVFVFSNLWGNRAGAAFAARVCSIERDNAYFCRLMRPTMSLVASVLFSIVLSGAPVTQLPAIWGGTVLKNFPMAFFWNMFAAAPFTHWLFGKLFP